MLAPGWRSHSVKLTDILAVYAASLSTIVFIWNARSSKPTLRTRIVHAAEQSDDGLKVGIRIEVQNPSIHMAHLNSVQLLYPWRKLSIWDRIMHMARYRRLPFLAGWCHTSLSNYDLADGCPVSIEPHKSHGIFIPDEVVEELLEDSIKPSIRILAQDALWRNQYSKPFAYRDH